MGHRGGESGGRDGGREVEAGREAEAGRADFRIEALVVEPQFARLFTEAERVRAHDLLQGEWPGG